MKITITKEFETADAAIAWLNRMDAGRYTITPGEAVAAQELVRQRKPRSDAGQPRGPYKKSTTGEPAASEPGTTANSVATTPEAPIAPTNSAAPVRDAQPASAPASALATEVPAAAEPSLTRDDLLAALKRITGTKGLGTAACLKFLTDFGTARVTDVPEARFDEFIAKANQLVADFEAAK